MEDHAKTSARHEIPGHITGIFIRRINRFVAEVSLTGGVTRAHVPNTGRLGELALPGSPVIMVPGRGLYPWQIRYIEQDGYPVMIDSIRTNRLVENLLSGRAIPPLAGMRIGATEPSMGNHRFDFELAGAGGKMFLEVKSCTLRWRTVSSFPDAVSSRAVSHVTLLSSTGRGMILFVILNRGTEVFVPNYHTDYLFYRALKEHGRALGIHAMALEMNENLGVSGTRQLPILIPEAGPGGSAVIISAAGEDGPWRMRILHDDDVDRAAQRMRRHITGAGERYLACFPFRGVRPDKVMESMESFGRPFPGGVEVPEGTANPLHDRNLWDRVGQMRFSDYLP